MKETARGRKTKSNWAGKRVEFEGGRGENICPNQDDSIIPSCLHWYSHGRPVGSFGQQHGIRAGVFTSISAGVIVITLAYILEFVTTFSLVTWANATVHFTTTFTTCIRIACSFYSHQKPKLFIRWRREKSVYKCLARDRSTTSFIMYRGRR